MSKENRNPLQELARVEGISKATFAAGCFWHVEAAFQKMEGVLKVTSGYTGGTTTNPTYEIVCTGTSGHAEAVEIVFDPKIVSYKKLLEMFWMCHDPTQIDRQGPDIGNEYRSAIFYQNKEQKTLAIKSKEEQQKKYNIPIITEIVEATTFYKAEESHQNFFKKHGRVCG
jgi:peptide-methionine (S)-S-oxide reductase